ncbi:MAG: sigma-54 dependent transcriptional regulator [Gemmatimonadota bacterium]|jgi:DNA-binding NtrC family response regulator
MEATVTIIGPRDAVFDKVGPVLRRAGYRVNVIESVTDLGSKVPPDLVLFDGCCAVGGGAPQIVSEARRAVPVPILQVSGCRVVEAVCRSHPNRADDFLLRPIEDAQLLEAVSRLLSRKAGRETFHGLVGRSEAVLKVFETVRRVAPLDCTVVIIGETGTGKDLAARAIHAQSPRSGGPFVAVDCAALPSTLLASELFGHVRGAFTGALHDKPGLLETSHGGTLFLDELADMPLPVQAMLLRALEERETRRIGATHRVPFDTRILAAAPRDPAELVAQGSLRQDFYYRLQGYTIHLPPLRERPGDIELLVETRATGRPAPAAVTKEAMEILRAYGWPGNVRELFAVVDSAQVRSEGSAVGVEHLPRHLLEWVRTEAPEAYAAALSANGSSDATLGAPAILAALHKAGGNRARAATLLGVSRTTLWRHMTSLGLRH